MNSKCSATPFIALTANAVAGVKERFLAQGFADYVSKPVDGKTLERVIQKYLAPEKVLASKADSAEETVAAENLEQAVPAASEEQIDLPTALKYCGGSAEMQKKFLSMFVSRRQAVCQQLDNDLQTENIADYTTHVHALKSTSLSIGGIKLSECAKALEMAGHGYCEGADAEKDQHLQYIQDHHQEALALYEALAAEAQERFAVN